MNKKFLFIGMAAILGASLSFFGCDDSSDSGGGVTKSDNAELTGVVVKGRPVDLTANQSVFQDTGTEDDPGSTDDPPAPADPTEGGTIANAIRFGVTIAKYRADDTTGAEGLETKFTAGDNGSFKAVYLAGSVKDPSETEFESDTDFPAYADGKLDDAAGGRFLVRVIPENEDTEKTRWYRIAVNVVTPVDVSGTVGVTAGDTNLEVTKTGGEYRNGLKVFVKDDGTGVTITTAEALAGSTKVTDVEPEGDVIPVITLGPATATGGSGVLKEGPVTVTLAGDAQEERVGGIAAMSFDPGAVYTLAYDGNGATAGTVPITTSHNGGTEAEVADKTADLEKTGYNFAGWNTKADKSGDDYAAGGMIRITEDTVLYAKWEAKTGKPSSSPVTVTKGAVPADVATVKFTKTGGDEDDPLTFAWDEDVSVTAEVTPADGSAYQNIYEWYLDGVPAASTVNIPAGVFARNKGSVPVKEKHTLVLVVTIDGEKYSEETIFTVTAPVTTPVTE